MTWSAVLPAVLGTRGQSSPHVLTLAPFYPSEGNPASGCFIAEPVRSLQNCGVKASVFVAQPFYRSAELGIAEFPADRVRFFSLPRGLGLPSAGKLLFYSLREKLSALHDMHPVDLIYAHSALPCGHAAWLLGKELRIPFVVTVHGLDASSRRQVGGAAGWLCEGISRQIYSAAQRVICVSKKVERAVLQVEARTRTQVIYNGVDCEQFTPAASLSGSPILLAVGNLIPTKGHKVLLQAFARLRREFPGVRCQIIGEGPEETRLKSLAEKWEISDSVEWLGRRNRSQVARALRNCTVFVLPSEYEGLGCVYLEAMASGKPVVACRGQGIDEVIRHGLNGWLVDPNDEIAL